VLHLETAVIISRLHESTMYIDVACCNREWHGLSVCLSVMMIMVPAKSHWTNQDAVWVVDSDGPKEPCIRSHYDGAVLRGKGQPIVKYRDCMWWAVQKRLNRLRCSLYVDSGGPKEACIRWECTLAQPGQYNWTVHMHWWYGLFVKLL